MGFNSGFKGLIYSKYSNLQLLATQPDPLTTNKIGAHLQSHFPDLRSCSPYFPLVVIKVQSQRTDVVNFVLWHYLDAFWRSPVRASPYDTNKSTNKTQLFSSSLLLEVHMWLNMFRASPRPSSGAYNCTRTVWFYLWKETAGELLSWYGLPDHDQQRSSRFLPKVEPEGPSAVVCSWWWARRRPKHVEPHMNVE